MSINVHLISRKVICMMEELEAMLHKYRCSRNACSGTCFPDIAVSNQSYQHLYQIKFIIDSRKIKHCDVRSNSTQSSMVFKSLLCCRMATLKYLPDHWNDLSTKCSPFDAGSDALPNSSFTQSDCIVMVSSIRGPQSASQASVKISRGWSPSFHLCDEQGWCLGGGRSVWCNGTKNSPSCSRFGVRPSLNALRAAWWRSLDFCRKEHKLCRNPAVGFLMMVNSYE